MTQEKRQYNYLLFELTKSCQNNCIFCYNVWKENGHYPREELSTKNAIFILDKAIQGSGCKHIALTGGEPLLKRGIYQIASFIASKGVMTILISNGKLLTKNAVERCNNSGINYFEVSLHSHKPAIHDRLVGRRGSFEEVIDAIINIKNTGCHVNTVFVATKENIHSFRDYVELNALLGVDLILFNRVACGGSCIAGWKSLAPSPNQIRQALDDGAPVAEKYNIRLSVGVQIPPCLVDLAKYKNVAYGYCPLNDLQSGESYFAIDPAGNVRMCNRSKTILGSLLDESFEDIARNQEIEAFGRAIPDFCLGCKLAELCAGGCKADAFSCFGTLNRPDPFLEEWKDQARKIQ